MDIERATEANPLKTLRHDLNRIQRNALGPTEEIGDLLVAVGVPVLLWDHAPRFLLVGWGVLVALIAVLWEVVNQHQRNADAGEESTLMVAFGWFATIVWGALPWIASSSLDDQGVVWILVFVVLIANAADTVFVAQTAAVTIDSMVLVYTSSYAVALALHGALIATGAVVIGAATFLIGASGMGGVINDLLHQRVQAERRNLVDDLTGIGTRLAATKRVKEFREAGVGIVYCGFFDLDDFKQLNDNYGYEAGDEALRNVATLLVEKLPPGWTVARFGGDEFVAIGNSQPDLSNIVLMRFGVSTHGGLVLSQPLSVGLTSCPANEAEVNTLFQEGAAALRLAKRRGKTQVVTMTDELRAMERSAVALGSTAAAALENREIIPWAQPIVELHSRRIAGMELLARWPQPNGVMVMPDRFVPVIEDQGRGPALGLLMIEHAITALAGPELRTSDIYISVNVSAKHLFHRRLPSEILTMLETHNVAPQRLVVEITESQHLPSSPVWRETASQLRAIGVGLAIDDFGTGYSSMEQLLSMPFSHLKVNRVMMEAIQRPGAAQMAAAIVSMASGSDMLTVAEGIETEVECAAMQNAGFTFGQGYLFSRPAPLEDVIHAAADQMQLAPPGAMPLARF